MAITISGGKYANNTISSVGTTTVTATTANFVATDFSSVQRIVGMWNSAGTTFLGMAFVRSFVSTSVLQLETAFYDPATGAIVAQTAGNIIIVSKNFTDSVTTNLSVSNGVVSVGDVLIFGTSTATSVCFYDQDVTLNMNYATSAGTTYFTQSMVGGLVVFGKLENYSTNFVSQPVNLNYGPSLNSAGQGSLYGFVTTGANSNFVYYGGVIGGTGISIPIYHGGYSGTAGYTMILNGVTCPYDLISPGAGGSWGAYASRMQLINCYTETAATNAIGRRWGDGVQSGGSFKFPYNTNQPISALGSNTGTTSFGAPPGTRATVLDFGANQITPGSSSTGGPVLTRGGPNSYWNLTNLIATAYWAGVGQTQGGQTVTADTSSANTLYFQDTFSNLSAGTVGNINTAGLSSSSSLYNTAATTAWSPSLLYSVTTGFTVTTAPPVGWYYGLKCYGKQTVSGTITPSSYPLIGANGVNVSFQQTVNQLTDSGVGSITQATANAYTSISTLDQLYAASSNWASLSAANATYPSISAYPINYSGSVLNLGNLNLVLASSGAAFSINTSTNTLTINCASLSGGTIFTSFTTTGSVTLGTGTITVPYTTSAGSSGVITLNNLLSGSTIVTDAGVATTNSGTSIILYTPPGTYPTFHYAITKYGYLPVYSTIAGTSGAVSATIVQSADVGITQTTQATVANYSSLANLDQLYDYWSYYLYTGTAGTGPTQYFTNAKSGAWTGAPLSKVGTAISFLSAITTFTLSTAAVTGTVATSSSSITIAGVASTLSPGPTTYSSLSAASVTSLTNTGITLQIPYTISAGTSGVITLNNLVAGSIVITDLGTSSSNSSTSITLYTAPGVYPTFHYAITKYGYLPIYNTIAGTSGAISATISQSVDVGTTSTQTTASTYTTLSTLDNIYDYWSYYLYATTTGATQLFTYCKAGSWTGAPLSKSATAIAVISSITSFTFTTTAITNTTSSSATAIVIAGVAANLAVGATTYQSLTAPGVTTFTLTGVTPQFVYTISAGTSLAVLLTVPSGSAVAILNGSGVIVTGGYNSATSGTSYAFYTTPGQTGTWTYKVAKYGLLPTSNTFTPSGQVTANINLSTDTGVTQPVANTVATYSIFTTLDQLYDYGAYWETLNTGISYTRPITKSGSQITLGAVPITVNGTASSIWTYTGSVLTVKSSTLSNGVTFGSLITTSTATFSNGAANQAVIYSSGGNSGVLTLTGLSGHTVYLQNNSAAQQSYTSSVTGTFTFYTPIGSTGTWTWVVKKVGYSYSTGTINAATGGLYTAAPFTPQKLNADGSVMYTGSSNPYCTVSFTGISEADILIGNSAVNVQYILDTTERALITNPGMIWLAANAECSQFLSSTGNYIFLTTKWRFLALNTLSPNATVNGYALSADGTPLNATNGSITFLSNILALQVAQSVWNYLTSAANTAGTMGGALQTINAGIQQASLLIPYTNSI